MRAVVLLKQVPDLRLGGVGVRADGTIDRAAAQPITNPADLHALEAALQLADDVCALSMACCVASPPWTARRVRSARRWLNGSTGHRPRGANRSPSMARR